GCEHGDADERPHAGIDDRARTDDGLPLRRQDFPGLLKAVTLFGGVVNEPARAADLVHHGVAGVDAQGAGDAFQLRAVADIDAGRAHGNAGVAVNAVTNLAALLRRLFGAARARLTAPFL